MTTDEKIETLNLGNLDIKKNIHIGGWHPDILSPGLSISFKSITLCGFPRYDFPQKKRAFSNV
jgi:hypothetical protein